MHIPQGLVANQIKSKVIQGIKNICLPKISECIPSKMGPIMIYHAVLYHFMVTGRIYYYSLLSGIIQFIIHVLRMVAQLAGINNGRWTLEH